MSEIRRGLINDCAIKRDNKSQRTSRRPSQDLMTETISSSETAESSMPGDSVGLSSVALPLLPSIDIRAEIPLETWLSTLQVYILYFHTLRHVDYVDFLQKFEQDQNLRFLSAFMQERAAYKLRLVIGERPTTSEAEQKAFASLEDNIFKTLMRAVIPDKDFPQMSKTSSRLYGKPFDVAFILDSCVVYHRHIAQFNKLIESVLAECPPLVKGFSDTVGDISGLLKGAVAVSKKSGKKAAKASASENDIGLAITKLHAYLQTSYTLHLLLKVSNTVSHCFAKDSDFMATLFDIYDEDLALLLNDLGGYDQSQGQEWYKTYVRAKQMTLSIAKCTLDAVGINALRAKLAPETLPKGQKLLNGKEASKMTEILSDFFFSRLDSINVDHAVVPFLTAPLLLDLENDIAISDLLKRLDDLLFKGEEARINFVVMSIDQLRSFIDTSTSGLHYLPRRRRRVEAPRIEGSFEQLSLSEPVDNDTSLAIQISEIKDLFPDYGEGFIGACIAQYGSTELVINALLEDSLPHELASMDRTMDTRAPTPPPTTILSTRDNVFSDSDIHWNNMSLGKANKTKGVLEDRSFMATQKQRILQAALAFDEDDDEYDDTYDSLNDVKDIDYKLVDEVEGEEDESEEERVEKLLLAAYSGDSTVFNRDQRRSKAREALRSSTNMSDEQLEGWYTMFERDPRKEQKLHAAEMRPNDNVGLARKEWVDAPRGGFRGKTRGGGGGNGGQRPEQQSQQSSEADRGRGRGSGRNRGRGRGGNHHRKDQHAKKMGRAMGPGT